MTNHRTSPQPAYLSRSKRSLRRDRSQISCSEILQSATECPKRSALRGHDEHGHLHAKSFGLMGMTSTLALSILCASVAAASVVTFDLTYTLAVSPQDAFETVHTVSALQGIVNKNAPMLWVNYTSVDPYWLNYTTSRGFLENATFAPIHDLSSLVTLFKSQLSGVVLYDPSEFSLQLLNSII